MYKILIFLNVLCSFLLELHALEVVPFIHSFAPVKGEDTIVYYVTNKLDECVAFEVSVFSRAQDENSADILEKDEDSFAVYPSQIIIPPHGRQSVKVKWLGNEKFKKNKAIEQAFRVRFEQFHVDTEQKRRSKKLGATIVISFRIFTSLYMTPESAKEKIEIISNNGAVIEIKNTGTKRISIDKASIMVGDKNLKDILAENDKKAVLLPGAKRKFKLAPPGDNKKR
jgi:fimbrial chaperone protein